MKKKKAEGGNNKEYIEKVRVALEQLSREKVIKAIKEDFSNGKISKETYLEAMKILGGKEIFHAKLSLQKEYTAREENNSKIEPEGHRTNQIDELIPEGRE